MYCAFDKCIIRIPLMPFDFLKRFLESKNFNMVLENDDIMKAIYVASPVLYNEIAKLKDKSETGIMADERMKSALCRYICRMCTRSTPFGLFAGCAIGEVADETLIRINKEVTLTVRLDMMYLGSLFQYFSEKESVKEMSLYRINSTLYEYAGKYRYIEYYYIYNRKKHQICSVEIDKYLTRIVREAKIGRTRKDLASILIKYEGVDENIAYDYIDELINSKILVNELEPIIIGQDPMSFFLDNIKNMSLNIQEYKKLQLLHNKLINLNGLSANKIGIESFKEIIEIIHDLRVPFEEKYLIQVDSNRTSSRAQISNDVIKELNDVIGFLKGITPYMENGDLRKFRDTFVSKFEEMEVPVLWALDPEFGVGFSDCDGESLDISPLIDDFKLPIKSRNPHFELTKVESVLLNKMRKAQASKTTEIILEDSDFIDIETDQELPITLYALFELLQDDSNGLLIKLDTIGGSTGANLITRFAHTDVNIGNLIKDIIRKEESLEPESIFVEIVHQPDERTGNILCRPHLRDYETVFLANSALDEDSILPLSDLMVSVKYGKIILRSKKLNKNVIPRLTNAHNYKSSKIPVYKFLCDLQMQNMKQGLYLHTPVLNTLLDFQPRIKYKNTILALAKWRIRINEISYLFRIRSTEEMLFSVNEWRILNSIPTQVLLLDMDNELYVNFESELCVKAFFSIIKNRKEILISEFVFNENNKVVMDENNKVYRNQFIVPFYKKI